MTGEIPSPPASALRRQSVEVKKVVEEYCPKEREDGMSVTTRRSSLSSSRRTTDHCRGRDYLHSTVTDEDEEIYTPRSEGRDNPENHTAWTPHRLIPLNSPAREESTPSQNCETAAEADTQGNAHGVRVAERQTTGMKDCAWRLWPSSPLCNGYEAAFLKSLPVQGLGRQSEPPPVSSPTESLRDKLYRKTKHVLDYTVTDAIGKPPVRCSSNQSQFFRPCLPVWHASNVPTSRRINRKELFRTTEIRKTQDGNPWLRLKGSIPSRERSNSTLSSTPSFTSTKGNASSSSSKETAINMPSVGRKTSNIIMEERKRCYYRDLCQQVEEKRQDRERERKKTALANREHNKTMQLCIWGKPGSGAPNYQLNSVRRTRFSSTGILPQEQLRSTGFSGTPFRVGVK
ncbi:uncharacterized protein LOC134034967 isoform X2 [Osmerus eperlanus]|uniref:uncharacterized protein LOC134034967 isoform X2 n=1 Tax=Osmerus eperlanus TaxID=29151 RepID=UPI002E1579B3